MSVEHSEDQGELSEDQHAAASNEDRRVPAHERSRFLAEASSVLNSSLDYDLTLQRLARLAVPEIADWCAVDLATENLEPGERVAVAHVEPEMVELAHDLHRRYPPDPNADTGLPNVLRTGRSALYAHINDQMFRETIDDPEHLEVALALHMRSGMIVPMIARGRTLGAITFVSSSDDRHFDEADLEMAEDLAGRAALAVDNARLFRETQQAWRNVSVRATQQRALAELARRGLELDAQALFDEALDTLRELLDADAAKLVELIPGESRLVMRAASGWDKSWLGAELAMADDGTSIGYALRRKEVVIVDDFDTSELRRSALLADTDVSSSLCVSVPGRRHPFGVLAVHARRKNAFSQDDADLIRGFSNVLSSVVEKERAERQREHMYQRLTRANKTREELLSIVSHDLRSPATAIKLNLEIIDMLAAQHDTDQGDIARAVSKAGANIDRMVALMDDLLAAFRYDADELSLAVEEIDFAQVVRTVISSHEADLLETGAELAVDLDEPVAGECDRMRLEQLVSNLLSNAIKYGEGKPISLSLKARTRDVELRVSDQGKGIPVDMQQEIFERFRRAEHHERRDSFGLGLWIVRRIVTALGGEIDVDSAPGRGTTFTVRLPRRQ